MTTGAIEKVQQQVALDTMGNVKWTRELVELCKRQVCPKGVSDDEFAVFMEQCKASGLNPFTKEAYCVPRNVKVSRKGEPDRWETVHTFQASIGGARSRAGRFPDFLGCTSSAVYEKDFCEVDVDAGVVRHKFNPCAGRGMLKGAWGKVLKKDGTAIVVWLSVGERSGASNFWKDTPGMMLAKCAEFAALCKAYPVQFTGVELEDEGDRAFPSRTQEVLEAVNSTATPAPAQTNLPPPPPPDPTVEFGEWKGRLVSSLTLEETEAAASYALQQLRDAKPGAKWIPKLEKNLELVQAHRDALASEIPVPSSPPPDVVDAEFTPTQDEPGSGG